MKKWISVILAALMLCGACAQADYQEGLTAENAGDVGRAFEIWEEAAARGDEDSAYALGYRYLKGVHTETDYAKAMEYFKIAAEQDLPKAQYAVGLMYRKGQGVQQDHAAAMEWYLKAAEQNYERALNDIGQIYDEQGDYAAAMEWYLKAYAVDEDKSGAPCTNIGQLYYKGRGVEQDYEKAMNWFLLGAQEGSAVSAYNIGIMYRKAEGVEQDYAMAAQWWEKALELDPDYIDALEWMSWVYQQNEYGMTPDYEKVHAYGQRAIELGSEYPIGGLARLYMEGLGVEKDYAQAIELYEKTAAGGDDSSMANIGWMYKQGGYGVETDYKAAYEWLTKAADLGNGWAMCMIGDLYNNGWYVEKDETLGREWKDKAVQHGHTHGS